MREKERKNSPSDYILKMPLCIPVLAFLIVIGTECSAWGADFFHDGFGAFSGWTYTSSSIGSFDASGYLFLSTGGGLDGTTTARKPLAVNLNPTDDFSFTALLKSGPDSPSTCGWFQAILRDANDNLVASLGWHDVQESSGYGGVDFYAQNSAAIYRTNTSGFGTEYAIFPASGIYGELTLKRTGSEWSAWVNGVQKGSTLALDPTLTATKIEIGMGHWADWGERALNVDDIAVTPEPATLLLLALGGLAVLRRRRK